MTESDFLSKTLDLHNPIDKILPAMYPHVDQTPSSAINHAKRHLSNEIDGLLKQRFRIINVWRLLKEVKNWPLAVCDARTVKEENLLATDYVRRGFIGKSYFVPHDPQHKWHYLCRQQPDEVMFKIHDSLDVESKWCPHASFSLGEEEKPPSRESIEVRALVFG
ncbi:hypothetical protein K458DRAFT_461283 [Lentithecium fluviatile CBS 122367]|uniref:Uncharacterized protein n=1 Tax=Lentithecium fluviatile CBS 122367 TaxID=1168545 RepID=A0A6G1IMB8_9PLEO|nr:hypothetical protein K458DRAFT_461283 [Lentithecium fluviatile CBS 122367]